ncbi:unnamed protein product [Sphagnum jensenii]|uniref:CCR4-NOT transcription complex subunit 3 n=1 Tax=Sphagnum jensenii TaxID=128206 RepID=A0ABP1BQE8_9BRYO
MGASRKLQGEIDKVLKKVQEGVDVFDSIWNKVYDTENANQKEKFESDLKKEIKKLQRYRDQIKTWIQSGEVKDKQALLDARKLIEREMERFKVCEKETKTKAFSKEGLGQQQKTDPREKAKSESRDWLNNMVSELESQIDSFEAEVEGFQLKKGKARSPHLVHLEDSITRHKLHLIKLELILRLLDNGGLSPDQVNEVKDFVEDYIERNQEDFEEFLDVDEIYQSLPLDKIEAMENSEAISIVLPAVGIKDKVPVGAGGVATEISTLASPRFHLHAIEESVISDSSAESPGASGAVAPTLGNPPASVVIPGSLNVVRSVSPIAFSSPTETLGLSCGWSGSVILGSVEGETAAKPLGVKSPVINITLEPAPIPLLGQAKQEEGVALVGSRTGAGVGKGALVSWKMGRAVVASQQSPPLSLPALSAFTPDLISSGFDLNKRTGMVSGDERPASAGLLQQVAASLNAQNGPVGQASTTLGETSSTGVGNRSGVIEGTPNSSSIFSPPPNSGGQWRPHSASSIQAPSELGLYHAHTEITPDQKEKFLQRYQQHQLGQSAAPLFCATPQIPPFPGPAAKEPLAHTSEPHSSSLQQKTQILQQQQAQTVVISAKQSTTLLQEPLVSSPPSLSPASTPPIPPLQPRRLLATLGLSTTQLLQSEQAIPLGTSSTHDGRTTGEPLIQQLAVPCEQTVDEASHDAVVSATFAESDTLPADDFMNGDMFDVVVGGPGTLAEMSQLSTEVNIAGGQRVLASRNPGVIARRSITTGNNLIPSCAGGNTSVQYDQLMNLQALDAAYHSLPLPKDSEGPCSYIPRCPKVTPGYYPQVQAPIVHSPALWEQLDKDVLFFAFYYQQGTYQQYLAARELKKQSWRYHKKYNTWFQRHEEPKITTDEYEMGTYVYFDFHIARDNFQQGWCQRIKTEFTFEYCYLEDELAV